MPMFGMHHNYWPMRALLFSEERQTVVKAKKLLYALFGKLQCANTRILWAKRQTASKGEEHPENFNWLCFYCQPIVGQVIASNTTR